MIGVVVSRADSASVSIGDQLRTIGDWQPFDDPSNPDGWGDTGARMDGVTIREFDDLHLDLDGVATAFEEPSLVVFASRHSGDTGPLLSTHFTGNIGAAEFGGAPETLATAAPNAAQHVVTALDDTAPTGYEVTLECTHHGPSDVGVPSLFVEVGSTTTEWSDDDAAHAAAAAILELVGVPPDTDRTVVTIGDGHYAPRGTRIARETDWAVGHMAPDWALEEGTLSADVLHQLFDRSNATHAVVTARFDHLTDRLHDAGYTVVTERWIHETSGVPLDRVTELESTICGVEDGLRFGELATTEEPVTVEELSSPIIDAANGVDVAATRAAIADTTTAFVTTDGGSRATGTVAVPTTAGVDPVVSGLVTVLRTGYDHVEVNEDAVVVEETIFDADAARSLGVPEGPAFGRLAAGEPVTVDGETISPEAVQTTRTEHLPR